MDHTPYLDGAGVTRVNVLSLGGLSESTRNSLTLADRVPPFDHK